MLFVLGICLHILTSILILTHRKFFSEHTNSCLNEKFVFTICILFMRVVHVWLRLWVRKIVKFVRFWSESPIKFYSIYLVFNANSKSDQVVVCECHTPNERGTRSGQVHWTNREMCAGKWNCRVSIKKLVGGIISIGWGHFHSNLKLWTAAKSLINSIDYEIMRDQIQKKTIFVSVPSLSQHESLKIGLQSHLLAMTNKIPQIMN